MSFGARFGQLVRRYRELKAISAKKLALEALGDEAKRSRISELENGKVTNPHAATINALCDYLGISDEEVEACRNPRAKDDGQAQADLDQIRDERGSLTAALDAVRDLSRSQLETLARRFEIDEPEAMRDGEITALLEKKAEEYRTYKTQIDHIDERVAGLGNLKDAAQDAAERLDFDEVENLLSTVHATELEIAWETASLRADNALLRGRTHQAFNLISTAADAFAAVDPIEPARRRTYENRLYSYALRHGGDGFLHTITLKRDALNRIKPNDRPKLFGDAWLGLGNALNKQGSRIGSDEGAKLLSDAITAYHAALRVYTEADHPVDWAIVQNNLGSALHEQGSRTGGKEGADLLAEAVSAYRAVLRVRTETHHPLYWALTQDNLGCALFRQGERTSGEESTELLAEAMFAFRAALRVHTEADHAFQWATTQNNLGGALSRQGQRTGGEEGAQLLAEAVTAYRAALRVRTEADHPVDWAQTQNNLGNELSDQGSRTVGEEGARLLAEAVVAYRAALRVHTETDSPVQWAETRENLAIAELAMAEHETCTDPRPHLEAALVDVDNALRVFDPEHMPFNFDKATRVRDRIAAKLAALDD
ncbi:MAG: helix-turn-helix transcriptional regulator [Pseudomonadota bacterium]